MKQFLVLVYDEKKSIMSSDYFEDSPSEQILDELISDGVMLECYEVRDDDSKLLFTMNNEEG
jgi:hypothetical protein